MITSGTVAKFTVAVILGIVSAHFWSIGEQRLAIFMIATTIFHLFFIVGEEKKATISPEDFSAQFKKEMAKWKKTNLFK